MYLRLTRARFDPARADQVVPIASEVRAAMARLPGLQHNHQGIDRVAGTVAAVSVWDSAEHAGFAREALGESIGRLRALGVQFEEPEIYEIMDGDG
jgi:phage tail tape-measure protein